MRALVFTRPNTVELLDVDEPTVDVDEVLVDVDAVGICGSELHGVRSTDFRQPPLIMGHEFSGTTPDGRRVTVNPLIACGVCDLCQRGLEHLCRTREILGIHRPGAFAERVAVPEASIHELPATMTFEQAALVEPLANGVHAVDLARPEEGMRIAVLGAGTIGLVSLLAAKQFTDDVAICDLSEHRLAVADRLGAARVTTVLDGEFDAIIDAVGAPSTHRLSIEHLRPGATAVWIGLLSTEAAFDAHAIVRHEQHVVGSYCYTNADFAKAVGLAATADLSWSDSFGLGDGATIFDELANGRHDVVKALLRPQHG